VHEFVQVNVAQRYMRDVRRVARKGDGIDGAAGGFRRLGPVLSVLRGLSVRR
jgi:hypothetical protein